MGVLHSQGQIWKPMNATTGKKKRRPCVPHLGVHLNILGRGLDPRPPPLPGRGQDLVCWDLECGVLTLRVRGLE